MTVHYTDESVTLHHGDALDVLRTLPAESIDAVITDPPYGIRFMGQAWDGADIESRTSRGRETNPMPEGVGGPNGGYRSAATEAGRYDMRPSANLAFQLWCTEWATECLRVLKPGGHLLSFGGSRTWHRLSSGIEDAGFEIRDSIAWLYGSGFPKSLDVSKAIASGTGRPEDIRRLQMGDDYQPSGRGRVNYDHGAGSAMNGSAGVTPLGDKSQWSGWGTALKPAFEPIVVGRKPLVGTVAANVLLHGTGALHIDACRVGDGSDSTPGVRGGSPDGRWPTNVLLDAHQAAELDSQTGVLTSGKMQPTHTDAGREVFGQNAAGGYTTMETYGDAGGASRFFPVFRYEAKAPASERPRVDGVSHPTVKPLALMRWLIRLVTPPGGTVLEPFAGSGTTIEACMQERVRCIAIERGAEYLPLIQSRIDKYHNPTAHLKAHTEDLGLFGLIDGAAS